MWWPDGRAWSSSSPLGEGATWRILGTRPRRDGDAPSGQTGEVDVSDVQQLLDAAGLEVTLSDLRWSVRVRLQHRLARSFRQGPLFLAGTPHTLTPRRRHKA